MAQPKSPIVPDALRPLVDELARLSRADRRLVVEAAERVGSPRAIGTLSPDEVQRLTGVVALGGNALEDCDALYDG